MHLTRTLALLLSALFLSFPAPAQKASMSKVAPPAKSAPKSTTPDLKEKAGAKGDLIDINRASEADLKTLPGIGAAYSAAIVKGRPYKNKTQLVGKKVIPQTTYDKIKDKVIAKQ